MKNFFPDPRSFLGWVGNFQVLNKLGEGAFSIVYKAKRLSDNKDYALKKVKMMNLSEKEKQNALNEVRILASINDINIISYKESFIEESTSCLCIVMDYADGGDLYNKILSYKKKGQNMPEKEVWHYFIQIIRGLATLHDMKIVHRDIKCANLFITKEGVLKLGDLNVSKIAKKGMLLTQTGTPYYASPEIWKDKPYDSKSDIWSVGCVLYEMCALNPPFRANDMSGLSQKICKGIYSPIPNCYSTDLANMIKNLLQVTPNNRPNCYQILSMTGTQNHLSETLQRLETTEESKVNLIGTIKMPRNIGQISERLPKSNYNSNPSAPSMPALKRNSSEPSRIGSGISSANPRDQLQSAKPGHDYLKGLVPIKERDEQPRSADPVRDNLKSKQPLNYQYQVKNQPKGYRDEGKENMKLPQINEKSYLQNRGAAILAAGNKYSPNQQKYNQIYQAYGAPQQQIHQYGKQANYAQVPPSRYPGAQERSHLAPINNYDYLRRGNRHIL